MTSDEVLSLTPGAHPASDAFHAALGFVEVGTDTVYDNSRTVRYLSYELPPYAAVAGGSASTE